MDGKRFVKRTGFSDVVFAIPSSPSHGYQKVTEVLDSEGVGRSNITDVYTANVRLTQQLLS